MSDTIRLSIDGHELEVPRGTLVIRAAEQLGITIPRFCDHPLLDPVGACRQCMVEVEGQRKPFTACTTQATDGMVVRTHLKSDVARAAQEAQLEFLLINHPLDCPQCDKGGECPLQDQTLAHGPPDTSMLDRKRRYIKPVPISAQILLDRERCVLCARCTRFSEQISGDPFIELFERGALEQVAIYEDEPYHSYFSGNVIQICPVGALTSATYRFNARPFDLRVVDSVCNQCSVGCNQRIDVRSGRIMRQLARQNMAVNEMWNCDKGRWGHEFVMSPDRFGQPLVRSGTGSPEPVSWRTALQHAADGLTSALSRGPDRVGVIAGARLADEDLYAVSRFARDVLRTDNVDFRMAPRTSDERPVLAALAGSLATTYEDVEAADVVVVAGLDPREEVPVLFLRLRKAWRKHRQKILVIGPTAGSLAEIAWRWLPTAVGDEARVLEELRDGKSSDDVADVAEVLAGARSVVVLAGERLAQSGGALPAAAALARDGGHAFAWVPRRTNARGAVDAGVLPGLLPGGRALAEPGPVAEAWRRLPQQTGLDTRGMLEAAAAGELDVLYLVGADPARDFEDPRLAEAALRRVPTLVVHELLPTASTRYADVLLPAAAPQERVGSFTTWEGRRQPFHQAVPRHGLSQRDWDIVRQLASVMGEDLGWEVASDVRREAAPLMEVAQKPITRLGELQVTPPPAVQPPDGYPLRAIAVDALLGDGTLLVGAKQLKETAPTASVVLSEQDARRFGVHENQSVAVSGPGGRWELPATVSRTVVPGCAVLPRNSYPMTPGALLADGASAGEPLWVTVEPLAGTAVRSGADALDTALREAPQTAEGATPASGEDG